MANEMGLGLPAVQESTGAAYNAEVRAEINRLLALIEAHDHTTGKGVAINAGRETLVHDSAYSDTTEVTGLNGNSVTAYRIEIEGQNNPSVALDIRVRFNGAVNDNDIKAAITGTAGAGTRGYWALAEDGNGPDYFNAYTVISTKTTRFRSGIGFCSVSDDTGANACALYHYGSWWKDSTTNITAITIAKLGGTITNGRLRVYAIT
ncbi:MAG TPA: hypothetical protein VD948_10240 [Rhodothermales bacterium]|nr:hypothetical protein [Rhodothermales bacterium]